VRKTSVPENLPWKCESPYLDEEKEVKGISTKAYFKSFQSELDGSLKPDSGLLQSRKGGMNQRELVNPFLLQSKYKTKRRSKSTNKYEGNYNIIIESDSEDLLPSIAIVSI